MYMNWGAWGLFFHNTPDLLFIVHVRRCMMIQDIYFHLSSIYSGWEDKEDQDPSFIRDRQTERSRIEIQLEEVRSGKVGIVDN